MRWILSAFLVLFVDSIAFSDEPDLKKVALDSVQDYKVEVSKSNVQLTRLEQPIIRFSTNGIDEGNIFLWTEEGRPAVAGQVFHLKNVEGGLWLHEFQSLSTAPLTLRRESKDLWSPKSAGVEWKILKTDLVPADSERGRLTQFKQLAREFSGGEQAPGIAGSAELKRFGLSLKPKEAYRYQSKAKQILDGVIFWFSQEENNDPELLLIIEALSDGNQNPWRYSLARMSCWPMQIDCGGTRVADFPNVLEKTTKSDPFHIWRPVIR